MYIEQPKLFEILVPCQWNDGKPVRTRHHKEWDKKVRKIANGMTILRPVKGQWNFEGRLYSERMIPVRVMCTDRQIGTIATMTILHYEQEAVMYYPVAEWVLIRGATNEERGKFKRPKETFLGEMKNAFS